MTVRQGAIVDVRYGDHELQFFIVSSTEVGQRPLLKGELYERAELEIIEEHVPQGSVILDIGANIGVHSVFYSKVMAAKQVIPFEPHASAIDLLRVNLKLNECNNVDQQFIGKGVAAQSGGGFAIKNPNENARGRTFLTQNPAGDIEVVSIDDAVDQHIDFVKIDVEGMEMEVLQGMRQTIERCRPVMFVEVNNSNEAEFQQFLLEIKYKVKLWAKRYEENCNFLILPGK